MSCKSSVRFVDCSWCFLSFSNGSFQWNKNPTYFGESLPWHYMIQRRTPPPMSKRIDAPATPVLNPNCGTSLSINQPLYIHLPTGSHKQRHWKMIYSKSDVSCSKNLQFPWFHRSFHRSPSLATLLLAPSAPMTTSTSRVFFSPLRALPSSPGQWFLWPWGGLAGDGGVWWFLDVFGCFLTPFSYGSRIKGVEIIKSINQSPS